MFSYIKFKKITGRDGYYLRKQLNMNKIDEYLDDKCEDYFSKNYKTNMLNLKAVNEMFWIELEYKCMEKNLFKYRIATVIGNFRNARVNTKTQMGMNKLFDDFVYL